MLLHLKPVKIILATTVTCLLVISTSFKKPEKPKPSKLPNIILIVADDLGYGDLGVYGAQKIKTPVIDGLANRGLRFTDAHTSSSLCSPSRYSILTGRYPWRTRLKRGVVATFDKPLIDSGRMTVASLLKKGGYYTAAVGKWHLGFNWTLKPGEKIINKEKWKVEAGNKVDFNSLLSGGPVSLGFDYYYGIPGSLNMMPYVIIENNRVTQAPIKEKTWYDTDFHGALRAPNWNSFTMGAKMTEKAVSIIYNHFDENKNLDENKNQPLFLYFPTPAIHRPALPNFTKDSSDAGLRGDMVEEFDWTVGQIVEALKRTGQLENTLLIITSDNGPRPGDPVTWFKELEKRPYGDSLLPKLYLDKKYQPELPFHRPGYGGPWMIYGHQAADGLLGFKEDPWEGGHRVPFIAYWPNEIKTGISNQMLCLSDLLATFADLVHQKLPDNAGEDSENMLAALLGTAKTNIRKNMVNVSGAGEFTIRMDQWKLIDVDSIARVDTHYPDKIMGPQLYNLAVDMEEKHNLYAQHPDIVKEMRQLLHSYQEQGHSAMRYFNP